MREAHRFGWYRMSLSTLLQYLVRWALRQACRSTGLGLCPDKSIIEQHSMHNDISSSPELVESTHQSFPSCKEQPYLTISSGAFWMKFILLILATLSDMKYLTACALSNEKWKLLPFATVLHLSISKYESHVFPQCCLLSRHCDQPVVVRSRYLCWISIHWSTLIAAQPCIQ